MSVLTRRIIIVVSRCAQIAMLFLVTSSSSSSSAYQSINPSIVTFNTRDIIANWLGWGRSNGKSTTKPLIGMWTMAARAMREEGRWVRGWKEAGRRRRWCRRGDRRFKFVAPNYIQWPASSARMHDVSNQLCALESIIFDALKSKTLLQSIALCRHRGPSRLVLLRPPSRSPAGDRRWSSSSVGRNDLMFDWWWWWWCVWMIVNA